MFDTVIDSDSHPAVARLDAALTDVAALDFAALPAGTLLAVLRDLERAVRRMPSVDHAVIAEIDGRGVAAAVSCRDTRALITALLRLAPGEASARVRAAHDLGPRLSLSGQPLPVVFPDVAAAQADGTISVTHAKVITTLISGLPDAVRDEHGTEVEKFLVSQAVVMNPHVLGQVCQRLTAVLDPDGTLTDDDHHRKHRGLTITRYRDGSGRISGYLTPILLAAVQTVLDSLAAPNPDHTDPIPAGADVTTPDDGDGEDHSGSPAPDVPAATRNTANDRDGTTVDHHNYIASGAEVCPDTGSSDYAAAPRVDSEIVGGDSVAQDQARRDPRSAAQRRHDALLAVCLRLLQSGTLPSSGGTPATILLTMTYSDLINRTGLATTGAGDQLSVPDVVKLAGDAGIIPVYMTDTGGVMNYGRTARLATAAQRRALAARDGGCSFPGCTMPPDWCQTHHLDDWIDGGETDIDRMTLVCSYNHLTSIPEGWECVMINGIPHWKAPSWLDPARTPIRNTANHQAIRLALPTVATQK